MSCPYLYTSNDFLGYNYLCKATNHNIDAYTAQSQCQKDYKICSIYRKYHGYKKTEVKK